MIDPNEVFETAAQIADAYGETYLRGSQASKAAKGIATSIRARMDKPFRTMEAWARIPLPKRLETAPHAKAAGELMNARSWHLEAFSCAFHREAGPEEASRWMLREVRKPLKDAVITEWEWVLKPQFREPPEEQLNADDCGRCGHARYQHIYCEGACRPGFECEAHCDKFVEPQKALTGPSAQPECPT